MRKADWFLKDKGIVYSDRRIRRSLIEGQNGGLRAKVQVENTNLQAEQAPMEKK
jgi:hypothetical protein